MLCRQPDSLRSATPEEFLPSISRWTTVGGVVLLTVVGVAIALLMILKYKITVKAEVKVRPLGELKIVQSPVEGQVLAIPVKVNQTVSAGEIITIIDDSKLKTQQQQLETKIQQANLELSQTQGGITALKEQISAETRKYAQSEKIATQELQQNRRQYQNQQVTTIANGEEATANLNIAQKELAKAKNQLIITESTLKSLEAGLNAAKSKVNRYQQVSQEGALSQNQLEEAQLELEEHIQAVEAQKAVILGQKETIKQQEQAVAVAQVQLNKAQTELNPSLAPVTIAQERISQTQAEAQATIAELTQELETLTQRQIQLQKQQERDRNELQQINLELKQTQITAPISGTITQLNLRNPGQIVQLGTNIAEIIPNQSYLELKASVLPQDINKLKLNQDVKIRISACPYPDYGTLSAKVRQISQDTLTNSNNSPLVNPFYQVTIQPDSDTFGQGSHQCILQSGMEGRADIIAKEETIAQFLLRKARLISDL